MGARTTNTPSRWRSTAAAALGLALLLEDHAWAYLDPGSISLFFQAAIAGVLGGLLVLKRYWAEVVSGIRRVFRPKPGDEHR